MHKTRIFIRFSFSDNRFLSAKLIKIVINQNLFQNFDNVSSLLKLKVKGNNKEEEEEEKRNKETKKQRNKHNHMERPE